MSFWMMFLAALVVGASANGEPTDSIFDRLAKVHEFAFGGVGEGGDTSEGEKDFHAILSRASALADFERLYSKGNPQAKAYALVGIHSLSQTRFEELANSLRNSKESVHAQSGCKSFDVPIENILQNIVAGRYSKIKAGDAEP